MSAELLETLPLVQRLALSYAPAAAREATLTLLALDARLAGIVSRRGEVLIAQIKLAWWRDRLREPRAQWPAGEPLLTRLEGWRTDPAALAALVDGWEGLLAEDLEEAVIHSFAEGRAAAWTALASELSVANDLGAIDRAAGDWALADLALHLGTGDEAQRARRLAMAPTDAPARLPRAMRPLAVLRGLAMRALLRGSDEPLDGPGAALAALRIGLSGR